MLAVDRQQRDAVRARLAHHQRPGHHQHFLVRERDVAAGADRGERGREAHRADQRGDHEVRRMLRHGLEPRGAHGDLDARAPEPLAQRRGQRGVGDRDERGPEALHLLRELLDVAPGRERGDRVALGEGFRDGERLLADTARAAEDREPARGSARARLHLRVRPRGGRRLSSPHARSRAPAGW